MLTKRTEQEKQEKREERKRKQAEYQKLHRDKANERNREYKIRKRLGIRLPTKHKWQTRFKDLKRKCTTKNIQLELTSLYFRDLISRSCWYCNTPGEPYVGIDRIDSEKGYLIDNCLPCCSMCNYMKNVYDRDKFLEQVKKIYENKC
jgi:hypothetical protein